MKFFKRILIVLVVVMTLITVFFTILFFIDYRPPKEQLIAENDCKVLTCDTFTILTWNIGYAGLDETMDFFYEGGTQVRQSKEQTAKNLYEICNFIKGNDSVDFILLQEVDINSKRTYNVNQFLEIEAAIPLFKSYFTINYNADFVPMPVSEPTGKVLSSLVFCTKHKFCTLMHYAYPNTMQLPSRAFLYDRCILVARYNLQNGKQLLIINTHNSAFDSGKQREEEMIFLRQFVTTEYELGNYVIVGGDWNQMPPESTDHAKTAGNFTTMKIPADFFPHGWRWFSGKIPTNRYLDKPYRIDENTTITLDFFLASPNVECMNIEVIDLQFANSDHNPIIAQFSIKKETRIIE